MSNFSKDFKRRVSTIPVLLVLFGIGLYLMAKVEPVSVKASNTDNVCGNKKSKMNKQFKFMHLTNYTNPLIWPYNQFYGIQTGLPGLNVQYYAAMMEANENRCKENECKTADKIKPTTETSKSDVLSVSVDAGRENISDKYVKSKTPIDPITEKNK